MIYLASQSPRRRELLQQIGVKHQVIQVAVDEQPRPRETPEDFVRRIALEKARAGKILLPDQLVLGADTAVILEHHILGKPLNEKDGIAMLLALSGREHRVLTGVALAAEKEHYRLSESLVRFRNISPREASSYWCTGEPADKAGGYAIQGLGAVFIQSISGSYSGVMGLPLFETAVLLESAGIPIIPV